LIDVAGETDRLAKQRARAADDLAKAQRKMSNESFVANAPPDIVAKERERMAELEQKIAQLTQQIERLAEIA
jgi:valyl-tRNA synthetase